MNKDQILQPEVWAVCDYSEGAGGYNAFMGVARRFADGAGLALRAVDFDKIVSKGFRTCVDEIVARGNDQSPSYRRNVVVRKAASDIFFRKNGGVPKAILTSFNSHFTRDKGQSEYNTTIPCSNAVYLANSLQVCGWDKFLPEHLHGLVPHNLTPELLASEAQRSYAKLKGDNRALIAIVLAQYILDEDLKQNFARIVRDHPEARFVISSSPRCSAHGFADFCRFFEPLLSPVQRDQLIIYHHKKDPVEQNPYKACLTFADHMMIVGSSLSMVSERLFAGRSVQYDNQNVANLKGIFAPTFYETNKIKFLPCSDSVTTETFPSIDATRPIAEKLVADYRSGKGFGA